MKVFARVNGQTLIELLIVMGVMAIILPALLTGLLASRQGKAQQNQRLQAVFFAREAQEAVRSVRNSAWPGFAVNGVYHPVKSATAWTLVSGAEVINGFTRQITIADTYRNSSGGVVISGGTVDPSTKTVSISVSWNTPMLSSVTTTLYVTRYLGNTTYIQTTQADFNAGTKTGVTVTNTSGGEVTLGAGGGGNWCAPALSINPLDLPKSGVANAISAIEGKAFVGTGDNSAGVSFANIAITNAHPPVPSISGTFDGYKTNGVFGEANYAYLATDNNSKEIEIIDLTHSPYAEAGYFNAPENEEGSSVYVSGNIGYMTDENKFYTFDLSSKSGSRPRLGSFTLAGEGMKVVVVGNYAYVAIAGSATELQVLNISNGGRTITLAASGDVNGQAAQDVYVNTTGTRAYVVTNASLSQREFFIINTTTKSGTLPILGSYDANGMSPKGVVVVPGNRAIIVGSGAEQYQVIDISTETNPIHCGGLTNPYGATSVNGISSVLEADGDAYSYILTNNAAKEFQIIEGGPGGQFSTNGTFTSSTFDAGSSVSFNNFVVNGTTPSQTTMQYQVASADANPATGNCTGVSFTTYVGPDGTPTTQFATSSAVPTSTSGGYRNPGRCFSYKVNLATSDILISPVFTDITVNYSP